MYVGKVEKEKLIRALTELITSDNYMRQKKITGLITGESRRNLVADIIVHQNS